MTAGLTAGASKELAKSVTVIPNYEITGTKTLILGNSFFSFRDRLQLMAHGQVWVSQNLYLKGGISPGHLHNDVFTMHFYGVGYQPDFILSSKITTRYEFNVHHVQWLESRNERWYSGSVTAVLHYKKRWYELSWIHLYDEVWKHEQFDVRIMQDLGEIFGSQLVLRLFRDGNRIRVLPVIDISVKL